MSSAVDARPGVPRRVSRDDSGAAPVVSDSDRELVERLEAAAADRWGEAFAISIRRWSDGTASIYAEHIRGLTAEGHRVKERLLPDGEGGFGVEVVTVTRQETVDREEIEYPVDVDGADRG